MASKKASKRDISGSPDPEELAGRKKKTAVQLACHNCKARKVKCDRLRPACSTCIRRSQVCTYENEAVDDRAPASETTSRPQRIEPRPDQREVAAHSHTPITKEAVEVQSASLQAMSTSDISLVATLSLNKAARATLPYTETALEYELLSKHQHAYQVIEPYEHPDVVADTLLAFSVTPYHHGIGHSAVYGPQASDKLCDERLGSLQITYWTTVPVSDSFAASVISLYLENMHPVLGTFDADLFLDDLAGHKHQYCSPFLVNAILYFGCQSYTVFNAAASQLSWAFYAEAKHLWQFESSVDSVLNVAALVNMASAGSGNGHDQEGTQFLQIARSMAERLGLDDEATNALHMMRGKQQGVLEDDLRFRSHVAWGYFNIVNGYAFYYHTPPTRGPGILPIPGPKEYPLPSYMGSTLPSICRLYRILREIVILYSGDQESITSRVPVAAMESKFQQILALCTNEPAFRTTGTDRRSHHAAILQIWTHIIIITLMRPWAGQSFFLRTFNAPASTPENIIAASLRQLKRLVTDFRLFYPEATYNIQWHPCLMFVANATLANSEHDSEWQFYFMICLYGYGTLSPAYRVAELLFKGLLTMAIDSGKIPVQRARWLSRLVEERGVIGAQQTAKSFSGIRLKLGGRRTGQEKSEDGRGTVEDLAKRFEESVVVDEVEEDDALFDEFIDMEGK